MIEFEPGETEDLTFEEKIFGGLCPSSISQLLRRDSVRVCKRRVGRLPCSQSESNPSGWQVP